MKPTIIGWSHSSFDTLDHMDVKRLIADTAREAFDHAGIDVRQIDSIHVGTFNGTSAYENISSASVFESVPELRFTSTVRCENACSTGSAAIYSALDALRSGRSTCTLVLGYEKTSSHPTAEIEEVARNRSYTRDLVQASDRLATIFGKLTQTYFDRYGDQSDALASIASKNYCNGISNHYVPTKRAFDFAFCRTPSDENPYVAGPLKRSDCSRISDGASALIIATPRVARRMKNAVEFRAAVQISDLHTLSRHDPIAFEGAQIAWRKGLAQAEMTLGDLSLVETHDCFTIAELIQYEAMGLAAPGKGANVILDGVTSKKGVLPVNPSGGLAARGHPIGATGVSMHVMAAMQVSGQAGKMQIRNARTAGVFNMGGVAVTNYLSILEARR
ncbi:thiolase domain-containing protein [Caballeronia sp. TF1N1]|uniref:thiolase domain-containing protein n=1 Tax=Caballeronia sp. TF1N1 TaxID=2878153 RepID=UPI001FD09A7A|nr:thiolase domain-containing protein [Caballeronia sp. TF1N1]